MKTARAIWNFFKMISPFIAILLLFLFLRELGMKNEAIRTFQSNLEIQSDSVSYYKTQYGQEVAEKRLFSVTALELRNQIWVRDDSISDLRKKLSNVQETVKIETEYRMPVQDINFDKPIAEPFFRNFKNNNEWYSISGEVTELGVRFHNVTMFNTQRIVRNEEKGESVLRVTNSNPYIKTTFIEGQTLKETRKRWVIGAGGIINVLDIKQSGLGVFVGYKVFEF